MSCCILTALLLFYIAAADSAFEDNDDAEYFHVSVSKCDEQLALYALIARAADDTIIPLSNCFLSDLHG